MTDTEKRLRRLEDRAELQDLVVRYFYAADDDDFAELEAVFTPDATFIFGGHVGGTSRQQVLEFLAAERKNMGVTVHTPHGMLFRFQDADHATGLVGAHLELARGGTTVISACRYADEYVRLDGQWRIRRRELLVIHAGPWEDVATSLTADLRARWPGYPAGPADLPRPRDK
jgi:SnoaL-like domain